ncbi:MAG TPA: flagellar basal body protein, partial [Stellaceae bacterium]|nr:flagellar basal body protein [Stellaceae bacterium]
MIDALGIAGSALLAQSTNLNVIANNVANATTPGYTAQQAMFVPMNPGVAVGAIVDTGESVDLTNEMVNLITAKAAYEAALNVVSATQQMTNRLLAA